jgi:hypothetical protein
VRGGAGQFLNTWATGQDESVPDCAWGAGGANRRRIPPSVIVPRRSRRQRPRPKNDHQMSRELSPPSCRTFSAERLVWKTSRTTEIVLTIMRSLIRRRVFRFNIADRPNIRLRHSLAFCNNALVRIISPGRPLPKRTTLLVFFALFGSPPNILCAQRFVADGVEIQVTAVIEFAAKPGKSIYEVDFEYRTQKPVIVAGLARVMGNGKLKFLTKEPKLVVSDASSGAKLAEWTLTTTDVPAGNPLKDLPDPASLLTFRLFETDTDPDKLEDTINSVLNKWFPQGLWPQAWKRPYQIITTYRGLENLTWPHLGKVAIAIEFPVAASPPHRSSFRISWTCSESAVKSSAWVTPCSKEVLDPATDFVEQRIREMTK